MEDLIVKVPRIVRGSDLYNTNGYYYDRESYEKALKIYMENIHLCTLKPLHLDNTFQNLYIVPQDVIGDILDIDDNFATIKIQSQYLDCFKHMKLPYIHFYLIGVMNKNIENEKPTATINMISKMYIADMEYDKVTLNRFKEHYKVV